MNYRKGFFKNILVVGGYNYVSQGVTFFSTIITARLLSPESFGFVGLITVFTGFIAIFSDSGVTLAVIKSDYSTTYHKAVDSLALVIGIVLFAITCLLAYPISIFYKNHDLILPTMVMASIFIFRSMSLVRGALLSKNMRFGTIGKITLISNIIGVGATIVMAYLGAEYWSIIIPQLLASLVVLFLYEANIKLGFKIYPVAYIKVAFRHTKHTVGNLMGFQLVNYWARNSDNLIVGRMYGVNDLGIYTRAYSLIVVPLRLITSLIGSVLFPSLNKLKNAGGEIFKEYFFVLKLITIICYPISFILIMFPDQLVLVLWGEDWVLVGKLLPYFGLLIFSQTLLSTTGNVLVLAGKEKQLRISGWVGAIVMICGISYGAVHSMVAIAQFYSLSFVAFVLPYNLFYVFLKTLKFPTKEMVMFWGPIIIVSCSIWMACYFEIESLKISSLLLMLLFIVSNVMGETKELYQKMVIRKRKGAFV